MSLVILDVAPELLVLATTAGSLMFSHFNDIGFWLFKDYYNVSVRQMFQIWTVMESMVAVVGLNGTLVLAQFVGVTPPRALHIGAHLEGCGPDEDVVAAAANDIASPLMRS